MRKRQKKKILFGKRSQDRRCPKWLRPLRDMGHARRYLWELGIRQLMGEARLMRKKQEE